PTRPARWVWTMARLGSSIFFRCCLRRSPPKRSAHATPGRAGGWAARVPWLIARPWGIGLAQQKDTHRFAVEANRGNFARSFTIDIPVTILEESARVRRDRARSEQSYFRLTTPFSAISFAPSPSVSPTGAHQAADQPNFYFWHDDGYDAGSMMMGRIRVVRFWATRLPLEPGPPRT